jgi:glycosyltransferase involved in cell wall biosynthesis
MRIAMLAPPWIPVPAPGYGGIEEVVRLLCDGLVARGHDVTLFAPPTSRSRADVQPLLDAPHPDQIERARWEVDHVAQAFAAIDAARGGRPYDVVHDHCGFCGLAMADRISTPVVHTVHGPFDEETAAFYAVHGGKATIVAISRAQLEDAPPALQDSDVVHNPLAFDEWPLQSEPGDHLLWIGRMAAIKGPHRAIAAARAADVPLVLAGPIQPGHEDFFAQEVEPHVDDDAVRYVGELGGDDKIRGYGAARAVLMPIRWAEPFGLVMVEAMACGTPVIAFREGSAPEVVDDGVTGFLVDDEDEMAAAIGRLGELDRAACRERAQERFGADRAVEGYEAVYGRAAESRHGRFTHRRRRSDLQQAGAPPRGAALGPAVARGRQGAGGVGGSGWGWMTGNVSERSESETTGSTS